MAVYFHGNFGLDRNRMASLLKLALENPDLKDKALAKPFGYGAPYAQRYRQWLYRTGITELRYPVRLTEMGKVVYQHDPELKSLVTQSYMHQQLVTDPVRAETWHFFWHEFLPQHMQFSKDELYRALTEKLSRDHSMEHFGPKSTMTPAITRLILECYTADKGLGGLGALELLDNSYHISFTAIDIFNSAKDLAGAYQ